MAVTDAQTTDVSGVLSAALADIGGLRVMAYVADKSRPPVAVIGLPTIDWQDPVSGFCWATWDYTITIITDRANDRDAQAELARLVRDVAVALDTFPTAGSGVELIQLVEARPGIATLNGQELPAYFVRVQVHA